MDTLLRLVLLLAGVALVLCEDPIVWIQNGKILGRDNGRYLSFESIPYAEPPTGANRFEPPKPYTTIWSGVRDATTPPEICIQWATIAAGADKVMGVEDCLTVSVYTPSIEYTDEYPVLVLLSAGVFTFGGSSWHGHEYVMKGGNAVVVKINFRLGALGFLSTEDAVIPGNFGLKDQLMALEWVKTNIAAFNGNPSNITVLGFGSGGASVHLHMMNKRLEKLASTAISFSGNAFNPSVITRKPLLRALHLAEYLGCPRDNSSQIKSCLQEKPAVDLARAIPHFFQFGFNPFVVFGPVIESKDVENPFINEELEDIIKAGKSAEIPWLASCDKDEGAFNAAELLQKYSGDVEIIEDLNERWTQMAPVIFFFNNTLTSDKFDAYSKELREKYMGDKPFSAANYRLLQKMYTDVLFLQGIEKALKLHKQYTHSPVYSYGYDNPAPTGFGQLLSRRDDIDFGTAHGDDFFLMFKSPPRSKALLSLSDHILSQKFIKMVVDFSLTGNLQFGTCKITPNNSTTKDLWIAHITKDYCEMVNVESIL